MPTVHDLIVDPSARPLVGVVPVASDDEVGRLTLLLAGLATGVSEVRRVGAGTGVVAVLGALRQLGVAVEGTDESTYLVHGVGLRGLAAPAGAIDVGASSGALSALTGVLVAQPFASRVVAAGALAERDVSGLAGALRLRGARIEGVFSPRRVGAMTTPLHIEGLELPHLLGEVEHALARPDAQLKTALLISGLYADGSTFVSEPLVSHDHIERLLQALDAPLSTVGSWVHLESIGWETRLPNFRSEVPGDFSAAALLLAAGLLVPESRVGTKNVGLNRTRTGFLEIAQQMGGSFDVEVHQHQLGEPVGVAVTSWAPLAAMVMDGEMLARAASETPMLLALAARAQGQSRVALPAQEPGPSADGATADELVAVLRAFGVNAQATDEGVTVAGRPEGALRAANVRCSHPDAAALALLLALLADQPSRIAGVDPLAARYPRIIGTLRALGADLHVEKRTE